jgi:hypothetical protein
MIYHVIIDSLNVEQEKLEKIALLLKERGFEFLEIRNRILQSFSTVPTMGQVISQAKLNEQEAMDFYRWKYDAEDLEKKIKHFNKNHTEIFFESGEKNIDSNEIWEDIAEHVFNGQLPLMFVVVTGEENGLYKPFIPEF